MNINLCSFYKTLFYQSQLIFCGRFVTFCRRNFNLTIKYKYKVGVENRWADFMELLKVLMAFISNRYVIKKINLFGNYIRRLLLNK